MFFSEKKNILIIRVFKLNWTRLKIVHVFFSQCIRSNHVNLRTRFFFKNNARRVLRSPSTRAGNTMAKRKRTITDLQNTTQKTIISPTAIYFFHRKLKSAVRKLIFRILIKFNLLSKIFRLNLILLRETLEGFSCIDFYLDLVFTDKANTKAVTSMLFSSLTFIIVFLLCDHLLLIAIFHVIIFRLRYSMSVMTIIWKIQR
jgi:hypothetical protein